MKKFYPLIIISAFFSASQAFSLENNAATQASKSTPINLVQEEQKLIAEVEQNIDDEGALEEGEEASEQELYQIELLVFAYVNTGEENSEIWRNPKRPDFARFKEALDDGRENQEAAIQHNKQLQKNLSAIIQHQAKQEEQEKSIERHFLDPEADDISEFKSIMRKMSINGHYRTLKHLVWQQQVMPREARDLFYLQGGENYLTESDLPSMNADDNTIKPLPDHQNGSSNNETSESSKAPAPYLNQGPGVPELEGSLHIYRSRFLHIIPDLWFTQFALNDAGQCLIDESENINATSNPVSTEIPETGAVESYTPLINFNLKQRRRLRSGELHYLDHPRFGVLIVFNKVAKDKENMETDQSTNADQENP